MFNFCIKLPIKIGWLHKACARNRARQTLITCLREEALRLQGQCSESTHTNRLTAINSLENFLCDTQPKARTIALADLTNDHIKAYVHWAIGHGLSVNYIRCNLRNLRALLNRLAPEGGRKLFDDIQTGNLRTDKRSAGEDTIRRLIQLPMEADTPDSRARDIFLFCLLMMGMPLIDAAYLRRKQVDEGYIVYSRRKTHRRVRVHITPELKAVIRRLSSASPHDSPYLLPILTSTAPNEAARQYQRFLQRYNQRLADISSRLGLERRLTSYTARHTWASLAFQYGVSPNTISQALCHSNPNTTLTYISDLSNAQLDQANNVVINGLFRDKIMGGR